jgi:hypothetical protein
VCVRGCDVGQRRWKLTGQIECEMCFIRALHCVRRADVYEEQHQGVVKVFGEDKHG